MLLPVDYARAAKLCEAAHGQGTGPMLATRYLGVFHMFAVAHSSPGSLQIGGNVLKKLVTRNAPRHEFCPPKFIC